MPLAIVVATSTPSTALITATRPFLMGMGPELMLAVEVAVAVEVVADAEVAAGVALVEVVVVVVDVAVSCDISKIANGLFIESLPAFDIVYVVAWLDIEMC